MPGILLLAKKIVKGILQAFVTVRWHGTRLPARVPLKLSDTERPRGCKQFVNLARQKHQSAHIKPGMIQAGAIGRRSRSTYGKHPKAFSPGSCYQSSSCSLQSAFCFRSQDIGKDSKAENSERYDSIFSRALARRHHERLENDKCATKKK